MSFKKSSFTIIELLLAIGISSVILSSAAGLYLMGLNSFRKSAVERELIQNGRVAIERLSREIRQTGELAVSLPESESEALSEIIFRDGHDTSEINYVRYYLDGGDLYREFGYYYFSSDSEKNHVTYNSVDIGGSAPVWNVEDGQNQVVAENFSQIKFFGSPLVKIRMELSKAGTSLNLASAALGRNIN